MDGWAVFYESLSDIEFFQLEGTEKKLHGKGWEPNGKCCNFMGQVGNPLGQAGNPIGEDGTFMGLIFKIEDGDL